MVFKFFLHFQCLEKYFFSSCLLPRKHLLIMDILPEAASQSPPSPQRDWRQLRGIVSLNSAFENADSQSSTSYEK